MGSSLGFDRMSCCCSGAAGRLPAVATQTALVYSDFHVLFTPYTTSVSFRPKSPSAQFIVVSLDISSVQLLNLCSVFTSVI